MSLFLLWLIGALILAIIGCCLIGLARRPVHWRTLNWTLAASALWPIVLFAVAIAVCIIICGIFRELLDEVGANGGVW